MRRILFPILLATAVALLLPGDASAQAPYLRPTNGRADGLALWLGPGTVAHCRNLTVTPETDKR